MEPVPVSRLVLNFFVQRGQTWVGSGLLRLIRKVRAESPAVAAMSVTAVPVGLTVTLLDAEWWPVDTPAEVVAMGIATSLYLPILRQDEVVAAVDLYSPDRIAFSGCLNRLAVACGSSADRAIMNADLGFHSREDAEDSGARLNDFDSVDLAIAYLVFTMGLGTEEARAYVHRVARNFGGDTIGAADMLINILSSRLKGQA